ncbi:ParB/Srx family N-terminal domain-containing protein [Rheinheimera baltica]|uniref:ParB/Srx family N-terminal domain-containing protein n=1 Tax=Rheinheimera baltica TaxID=67576 RepID=UPI00042792FA|nr:ParB/Srx family N-terminal domain-containing protein [Rheinheimera baltica]
MSKENKNWWENRVLRSVDNLKLWHDNPRLDPANKLITVRDYVEELIADPTDEQKFIDLMKSIATRGFLSFDPVVVWQNEDQHFVVAEGNRRVMALKLLRSPDKAPLSIRKTVVSLSRTVDRDAIEKIRVCLAPSYEECRWYILQRHSPSASDQIRWQRLQQQRFIINVFDSVGQDIEETINLTGFKRAAIIDALRYVKIRDIATHPDVTKYLTLEEREQAYSHRISMTVLERWFGNSQVRAAWHIEFDDSGVLINADANSFYVAYAKFLKLMLNKNNELGFMVNTRTIDSKFQEIFDYLPKVKSINEVESTNVALPTQDNPSVLKIDNSQDNSNIDLKPELTPELTPKTSLKGNPKRRQLTDKYHRITHSNYKIKALFEELQGLPVYKYPNVSAASIRIFLELAVDEYINSSELKVEMARREKKGYHEITLSQKLTILRGEFIDDRDANKVIDQLLHNSNDHSLNTLNEYIHGNKVHKVEPQFLNRFWDMLSPLLSILINLKEI